MKLRKNQSNVRVLPLWYGEHGIEVDPWVVVPEL
jgi:hypothetical protein